MKPIKAVNRELKQKKLQPILWAVWDLLMPSGQETHWA